MAPPGFFSRQGKNVCCGCLNLFVGVELICISHIIANLITIASTSSVYNVKFLSVVVPPHTQVFFGTWCLLGLPIVISAAFAAVYKMEQQLRLYAAYLGVTTVIVILWGTYILSFGGVCDAVFTKDIQRLGSQFVCGFTDSIAIFYMIILSVCLIYFTYKVNKAAAKVLEDRKGAEQALLEQEAHLAGATEYDSIKP